MHFDRHHFVCSCQREKSFNDLKFGTFIGRFPNDGPASMAVERLTSTETIRLTIYKEEEAGGSTNSRAVSQLTADDLSILHTPAVVTDGAPRSVDVDLHPALPRVVAAHQANVTLTCASNRLHALMTPLKGEGIMDGRHCTRVGFQTQLQQ